MKAKLILTMAAALLLAACSHNPRREARPVPVAYECYDWWPYVYYGPYDCWHSVWYGPAYYYYPYRTYSYPGAPTVAARRGDTVPKARERIRGSLPLPDRDDSLSAPPLPRPELPRLP